MRDRTTIAFARSPRLPGRCVWLAAAYAAAVAAPDEAAARTLDDARSGFPSSAFHDLSPRTTLPDGLVGDTDDDEPETTGAHGTSRLARLVARPALDSAGTAPTRVFSSRVERFTYIRHYRLNSLDSARGPPAKHV
ncbi:MAG: hypothetical protein HY905_08645 [Deltaproteobacteria bacterium]|nr:hypothetical protein [Deltaproteobacteria bacterium]